MFRVHDEDSMIACLGEESNDMCDHRIGMDMAARVPLFLLRSRLANFGEITQNVSIHWDFAFVYSSQLDITRRRIANKHAVFIHNSNAAQTLVIQQRERIGRIGSIDNTDNILQIRQTGFIQSLGKILARDCNRTSKRLYIEI